MTVLGLPIRFLTTAALAGCLLFPALAAAAEPKDSGVPNALPDPLAEFAVAVNFGYGQGVKESEDPATFEKLLINMKKAGYNTIYCVYRDWRLELCRKHNVKMMIDVLAWFDDAKTDVRRPEQRDHVRRICEKVKGDKSVWGYNLWNERLDHFTPGGLDAMNENLALLRKWDPTHPVWVGTYLGYFLDRVQGTAGMLAYYDYHWSRGLPLCYTTLTNAFKLCQNRGDHFGCWILVNKDNRKSLYTINASIAHGMKTMIWFIGGAVNPKTGELDEKHEHIAVGQELSKLYAEIAKIDKPTAVYSTPTTRTMDDKEKKPDVPRPLTPFPADCWAQVKSGEAMVGFFKYDEGFDALYVANHNAFQPQKMTFHVKPSGTEAPRVELFDRGTGQWKKLAVEDGSFSFELYPGGGELLRLSGVASE